MLNWFGFWWSLRVAQCAIKNEDRAPKLVPARQSCTLDPVRSGQFVSFNGFAAVPFLAFHGFGLGAAFWHSAFGPALWRSIVSFPPPVGVQWFCFRSHPLTFNGLIFAGPSVPLQMRIPRQDWYPRGKAARSTPRALVSSCRSVVSFRFRFLAFSGFAFGPALWH